MTMVRKPKPVIHSDPEIMGGQPVFVGTRVPVSFLWEYLEAGDSLEDFLFQYPTVSRKNALAALKLAKERLIADARPAR